MNPAKECVHLTAGGACPGNCIECVYEREHQDCVGTADKVLEALQDPKAQEHVRTKSGQMLRPKVGL